MLRPARPTWPGPRALARQLDMLSRAQDAIIHATNEPDLLDEACDLLVTVGGYRMAWVGAKGPPPERAVMPVARAGAGTDYLDEVRITWGAGEHGQGPSGCCVRSGKAQVARDVVRDPRFAPWRAQAVARGYASSAALPMIVDDEVIGALMVYSERADAFDRDEQALLERLARNLAHGVRSLRNEEARRVAEAAALQWEAVIEHVPLGVAVSDPDGQRFDRVNDAFARMYGRTPEEMQGMPIAEVYVPEDRPAIADRIAAARRGTHRYTSHHVRKDGSTFPVQVEIVSFRAPDGTTRAFAFVEDRTEAEKVEAELQEAAEQAREVTRLREADALRARLMHEVAHELKNPLSTARIQLHLLQQALADDADALRHLGTFRRAMGRVAKITDDLLDAARVGTGRLRLQSSRIDLTKHVRDQLRDARGAVEAAGLELHAELAADVHVTADPTRLAQVLDNIIGNACKYTPPDGRIEVRVAVEDDRARIEVRDTGVGLPDDVDDIFLPFGRGRRPVRQSDTSTGLGLYVTKRLVELMGGEIGCRREDPGSTFWFTLPLA